MLLQDVRVVLGAVAFSTVEVGCVGVSRLGLPDLRHSVRLSGCGDRWVVQDLDGQGHALARTKRESSCVLDVDLQDVLDLVHDTKP